MQIKSQDSVVGLWSAGGAHLLWGFLPIYWKELTQVPAMEVMMHRLLWSFLLLLLFLIIIRRLKRTLIALRNWRTLGFMLASGLFISANWLVFIWAVNLNQIVAASLGYFLVPIFNMLCGMIIFKDRISHTQWVAVILALVGVATQIIMAGELPWISLAVCVCFGMYGLLRKAAPLEAVPGLFVETMLMMPIVTLYLGFMWFNNELYFGAQASAWQNAMLVASGLITTLPLIFYAHGARNLKLTTLGLFQYTSPTVNLLVGVLIYGEPIGLGHIISFACIWTGLLIYTLVGLRQHHHLAKMIKP